MTKNVVLVSGQLMPWPLYQQGNLTCAPVSRRLGGPQRQSGLWS